MKRNELEGEFAKIDTPTRANYLREIFSRLFNLLDIHCSGYFLILSEQVDDAYIRLRRMAQSITNTPGLEKLQASFPSTLPDTLHEIGEEADMHWEYGLRSDLNTFKGRVLEFCVEAGSEKSNDEALKVLLEPFDKLIDAYKKDKSRREQAWEAKVTEKTNSAQAMSQQDESPRSTMPDNNRNTPIDEELGAMSEVDPSKVFVVHGRDEQIRREMFSFLRAIHLHPIEWIEAVKMTGIGTPYVGEVLDAVFANAQAIVILMTPDDEGKLLDEFITEQDPEHEKRLTPQARQNVVFETGLALGRDPKRTIIVEIGRLRPFSDIIGRHTIRLNNSTEAKHSLAERLRTAGCAVDTTGSDWFNVGDFDLSGTNDPITEGGARKSPQPGSGTVGLEENEVSTLRQLANLGRISTVSNIAQKLGVHRERAQYYLDSLSEHEYVAYSVAGYDGTPAGYRLAPKGREYLVKNDLLT